MKRRIFIKQSVAISAGLGVAGFACTNTSNTSAEGEEVAKTTDAASKEPLFKISLAEWSLNSYLFNPEIRSMSFDKIMDRFKTDYNSIVSGSKISNLEFPAKARELGIEGVEFVNQFFYDKAKNTEYLNELKNRCNSEGVKPLLIMCDLEGELGNPDAAERAKAVENHYKWVDAAKFLGCHSIRVNASSQGSFEEQQKLAADGLSSLAEYAEKAGIHVLVENHGGLSSNGEWLSGVMKMANNPHLGTLPDFGNFCIKRDGYSPENPNPECMDEYDRYKGVAELMPFAKGVSAKTHDFNSEGEEIHTDYEEMMRIVLDAGFRGYVGIEYEGNDLEAVEGIKATKNLLEQVRTKLTSEYA
ncbi:sugar phosphate isomerase/epimerase family protein [Catalinimonas niigatensis]|uniref:sugar phosphate isomerase/epimerase family protein n=1 Tax=Catalinimonas niigatensis TaxID=1397264 RepID=UPI002666B253|nr:sugar phosphate isomerase/epimerase family protein [Catalinimonas niigatensis]WPP48858.1 sugar phosphate isomerase/epimerase family protein [Catalinimonas niigatensis]